MAFKKNTQTTKKENAEQAEKKAFAVLVDSAHVINEKRVLFNAYVNGVKVDGFALCEYENQKKETGYIVQFPSRKASINGEEKYFNIVWFPISKELREDIVNQVFSLVG